MEIWEHLIKRAISHIEQSMLPPNSDDRIHWSWGGGTVLMSRFSHRTSKDIDIFLSDPQFLGYFSPRLNDGMDDIGQYEEQAEYIKLIYPEGEIDFIVGSSLSLDPYVKKEVFGRMVFCESTVEILAKKIVYRHRDFKTRDFFDLATALYFGTESERNEIKVFLQPYSHTLIKQLRKTEDFPFLETLSAGKVILEKGIEILEKTLMSFDPDHSEPVH